MQQGVSWWSAVVLKTVAGSLSGLSVQLFYPYFIVKTHTYTQLSHNLAQWLDDLLERMLSLLVLRGISLSFLFLFLLLCLNGCNWGGHVQKEARS